MGNNKLVWNFYFRSNWTKCQPETSHSPTENLVRRWKSDVYWIFAVHRDLHKGTSEAAASKWPRCRDLERSFKCVCRCCGGGGGRRGGGGRGCVSSVRHLPGCLSEQCQLITELTTWRDRLAFAQVRVSYFLLPTLKANNTPTIPVRLFCSEEFEEIR